MKRIGLILVALILASGAGAAVVRGAGSFSAVYSVAELRADLARHPGAWLGHTVLVRGVVSGGWFPLVLHGVGAGSGRPVVVFHRAMLPAPALPPLPGGFLTGARLTDSSTPSPTASLPLALGGEDPLLAFLRRLPWVGRFVPPPRGLQWGASAIYHVRLQAAPSGSCGHAVCYEAVLLDSMPQAPLLFRVASWATIVSVGRHTPLPIFVHPAHARANLLIRRGLVGTLVLPPLSGILVRQGHIGVRVLSGRVGPPVRPGRVMSAPHSNP